MLPEPWQMFGDHCKTFLRHTHKHQFTGELTKIIETFAQISHISCENTGICLATIKFAKMLMDMFINSLATGEWEKNQRE